MPISAPPPAPSTTDPTTFAARADAWLVYWELMVPQLNALQEDVTTKRNQTQAAAAAAALSAQEATTQANTARDLVNVAKALPITPASSVTNIVIPAPGAQVTGILAENAKGWGIGNKIRWVNRANVDQWMEGVITAFEPGPAGANPRQMTFTVTASEGEGVAAANWSVITALGAVSTIADITDYEADQAARRNDLDDEFEADRNRLEELEGGRDPVMLLTPNNAGVLTIDLGGDKVDFKVVTNANITGINFINPPVSGRLKRFQMRLAFTGVARTIAWPAAVKWASGVPSFSYTNGKEALLSFYTDDAGAKYHGFFAGESG